MSITGFGASLFLYNTDFYDVVAKSDHHDLGLLKTLLDLLVVCALLLDLERLTRVASLFIKKRQIAFLIQPQHTPLDTLRLRHVLESFDLQRSVGIAHDANEFVVPFHQPLLLLGAKHVERHGQTVLDDLERRFHQLLLLRRLHGDVLLAERDVRGDGVDDLLLCIVAKALRLVLLQKATHGPQLLAHLAHRLRQALGVASRRIEQLLAVFPVLDASRVHGGRPPSEPCGNKPYLTCTKYESIRLGAISSTKSSFTTTMDDLYGDLDTSTQALAKTELQQEKQRVEKENDKLKTELAELQLQNRLLGERTKALETNISTLFVTAQHELKRKDAEIQRLREALTKAERRDSARSDHQSHRRYHESRGDSPSRRSGHSHR